MTAIPPTSRPALDEALRELRAASRRFARLPIADRLMLIDKAIDGMLEVQEEWVEASCRAKGIDPTSPMSGEEWLGGPMTTIRNLRLLREALMDVRDYGHPRLPDDGVSVGAHGHTVAQVFPVSVYDKLLFQGFSAEVWLQEGVTPENLHEHMACAYHDEDPQGRVSLVLGGGNVSSIGPMDALYKLFVENEVCLLKMHPVNEYVGPLIERAFAAAIEADFLKVVYGGGEVGDYLCKHAQVDTIHITGSDKTHDLIVWGPPGEQEERKTRGEPLNEKPISSELGNVSPVIVVPGEWSDKDLAFQAENVATMVANNASFNCNAAKLLVVSDQWPQRQAFLDEVTRVLREVRPRKAYYPGAQQRYQQFLDAYDSARPLSERTDDVVPWTLIPGVDPEDAGMCLSTEPFCGVLTEVALPGGTAGDFLRQAATFCNEKVWGTLNATLLVHPKTLKDPAAARALEAAIADLRYGTVSVNHWPAVAYGIGYAAWGAYPGHSLEDIQSGRGVVHNTFMFDKVQKTVVRGPFRVAPKPPWFVTNKRSHEVARRLCSFEAYPSVAKLPGIMVNALMG